MKNFLTIVALFLILVSCMSDANDKTSILIAGIKTPMGNINLNIFEDHTFILEKRRLLKKTFFEGNVNIVANSLQFEYIGQAPDFGEVAVIDESFLTFTNGIYNELLEISVNRLPK